jgi:hypothetical protein
MWNRAQFCGVAGRFDDDIEFNFIVSNCGMAFIGNGETVSYLMLSLQQGQEVNQTLLSYSFVHILLTSERQERSCSVTARSQTKFSAT